MESYVFCRFSGDDEMKEVPYIENYAEGTEEEKTGRKCEWCGEEIVEGQDMVDIDGTLYHADCLFSRTENYIAQAFGYRIRKAG